MGRVVGCRTRGAGVVLIALVVSFSAARPAVAQDSPAASGDGLKPGDVLNQSNWEKAKGMLPPEILKHYQNGEYANPIVEWKEGTFNWPPDFRASSEANRGRYDVDAEGAVIEKSTGKQPKRIFGQPFLDIDTKDPKVAVKILWNYFYLTWFYGNLHAQSQVNWVSPREMERRSDQDVRFLYYDGQSEDETPPNPQNFLSQLLVETTAPADLNGTSALSWRYRDARKRDSAWAYVPALRRVRAVSPANRSDGFLGSDMSQDDGPFFDGKPEDFDWTLAGEVEYFRLVDPPNLEGKSNSKWQPQGGWRPFWDPDLKIVGYMDPQWKGVAWAPRSQGLAKRKLWVIEGIPKDRYYLYGKIQLHLDKETYQGSWNRKFDWHGELVNVVQVIAYDLQKYTRPNGKVDYIQGSNMSYLCAESIRGNRATIAGLKTAPNSALDVHVPPEPSKFLVDALGRVGK
jgi:hypothetical protein